MWFLKHSLFFCFFVSSVPDFSIDTLSTNASQELRGLGITKVSGLERSQEKSQETSRELSLATRSLVPTSHPKPPLPAPLHIQPPPSNRGLPLPPSLAQTQHPCPERPLRPLSPPTTLPQTQGQEPSQAPPAQPQHPPEPPPHPRPPRTPSIYHHPPSPVLPTQQNPNQPVQHRPPSRCHPRPISAYSSSLNLNGLRWVGSKGV